MVIVLNIQSYIKHTSMGIICTQPKEIVTTAAVATATTTTTTTTTTNSMELSLLQTLLVTQLVQKLPTFHGILKFITMFTRPYLSIVYSYQMFLKVCSA
jgi:hypothetical protein